MIFGGMQKTSLIDFPGKVSCILFTPGCNFICPYCHNPDLAAYRTDQLSMVTTNAALELLAARRALLDGVVVTGGEPLLHKDLGAFLEEVKQLGFQIKIDTNGSKPEALAALIANGLVDYIAMDVKTDPDGYAPDLHPTGVAQQIRKSVRLILSSGIAHEFRTTCLHPFVNETIMTSIGRLIEGADLYALQRFHGQKVLRPNHIREKTTPCTEQELTAFKHMVSHRITRCIIR